MPQLFYQRELLSNEWVRLEELARLLEPFCRSDRRLQRDAQAVSGIISALLNLECHLLQHARSSEGIGVISVIKTASSLRVNAAAHRG
jgi:hypothetical protein